MHPSSDAREQPNQQKKFIKIQSGSAGIEQPLSGSQFAGRSSGDASRQSYDDYDEKKGGH